MNITWYGTASIAIHSEQNKLLFDPFIPLKGSTIPTSLSDYKGFENILITHGHLDHIVSLPEIYKQNHAKIYCSKTPYHTLKNKGIPATDLVQIAPGNQLVFGDVKVTVYKGRHVKFDKETITGVLRSKRLHSYKENIPYLFRENRRCRENGETLFFDVKTGDKHIFVMGSLGLDEAERYPTDCDVLVLPYQGCSDLLHPALHIIDILKPKKILLDHWDDTFPPVSKTVDTTELKLALEEKIPVVKPEYCCEINI